MQCGGGYVAFVDSDDSVDPDYIQTLYENVGDADAVACGGREVADGTVVRTYMPEDRIYETNRQIQDAYKQKGNLFSLYRAPFTKLYRSGVIGELRFDESLKAGGEDIVFNIEFLRKASKVRTIRYCGYNYYSNTDSITRSRALRYCETKEDEYGHYRKIREAALKKWGFQDDFFLEEEKRRKVLRYFAQVQNMLLPGTPYSKKQVREKIKEIHADPTFAQAARSYAYKDLPLRGKLAKLSAQFDMPRFTVWMFSCVTWAQIAVGRSAKLSKWVNQCRKR